MSDEAKALWLFAEEDWRLVSVFVIITNYLMRSY
jgi:hypothetical protein